MVPGFVAKGYDIGESNTVYSGDDDLNCHGRSRLRRYM